MKRFVLSTLFLLAIGATTASAQIARWGITAGMNVSKIHWENVENVKPESENGWYTGITGKVTIPVIGIGVDGALVYSQEGVNAGFEGCKTDIAHFLSVPMHLRYDLEIWGLEEIVIPFGMIGPQFNYAMNDLEFESFEGHSVEHIIKKANTWRLDLGFGAILFEHLQVSYSYGIPLGEAIKFDDKSQSAEVNYNLGTHRLGLVYYF